MNITYYFWAVAILLIVLEVFTPSNFIFFSLGVACLLSSFFFYLGLKVEVVLIIFSFFAILTFYIMKKFRIFSVKKEYKSNVDYYVGKKVKIIEKTGEKEYKVKVFSEEWAAYSEKDYEIGDKAEILKVEGTKLIIE